MRTAWCLVLSLVLLGVAVQAEDGGVLTFNPKAITDTAPAPWPTNFNLPFNSRSATMQLDGSAPEQVISGSCNGHLVAASFSPPYRFFFDQNSDGKCQSEEVHSASESTSLTRLFIGVPYPAHIGGITQTLLTDIEVLAYSSKFSNFTVKRIQSGYQGKVSIGGSEYPALLAYRSLGSRNDSIDGVLLLDINGDGSFDHFHDPWMLCNGEGAFAGEVWDVTTTFSGETATVKVTPYTGETGLLHVTGEGVLRVYLDIPYATRTASIFPWSFVEASQFSICLERRDDGLYKLPAGYYSILKTWIGSPTSTEALFEMGGSQTRSTSKPLSIIAGASVTESLGGPLTQKMETNTFWALMGYVFLNPGDFRNSSGTTFQPTSLSAILGGENVRRRAPGYEIRNSAGRVVTSGKFEYG